MAAADYNNKVQAYFVAFLGRPASSSELAQYSEALNANTGSVWTSGLNAYLAGLAGLGADKPTLSAAGTMVTEMFANITGTTNMDMTNYNFYVGQLLSGSIKPRGLANAMLNDFSLMPRDDGQYTQPTGWPTQKTVTTAERDALVAKVDFAGDFTAALDTPAEDQAIGSSPAAAKALLATVTSAATAATAAASIASTIAATVDAANTVAGQAFTLTTSLDTGAAFTGGTGADTFSALETEVTTPATDTFTSGDSLDGGAGTDKLTISISGTPVGATTAGVATKSIEQVSIFNNSTAAYTLDATLMQGVTDVYLNGGTAATTINAIGSLPNVHLLNTSVGATVTATAAATVGTADAVTVLSSGSALTASPILTYNGVETVNLALAGVTGTATGNELVISGDELEKIVVTGSANGYVRTTLSGNTTVAQVNTVDASAATGNLTVSITRGTGSDASSITMGSGNDHVIFSSAATEKDTIVGGTGTDTIELSSDMDYSTTTTTLNDDASGISGFEVLRLQAGVDIDGRLLTGTNAFTTLTLEGSGSLDYAPVSITTVNQIAAGTSIFDLTTDGSTDALTYNVNVATAAGITTTLTALDHETITINSAGTTGTNTITLAGATADTTRVNVAGNQSVALTVAGTALATVDASGLTGLGESFTLTASASTANMTVTPSGVTPVNADTLANTITTGAGNDVVTGTANRDSLVGNAGNDSLSGGAGNDAILGGAGADTLAGGDGDDALDDSTGNDVVTGGAGNDTFTVGAGEDNLDGGAGNDTFTVGTNLSSGDTINGGADTDSLTATLASIGIAPTITAVETVGISFQTSTYLDMANVTGATSLTVDSESAGGVSATLRAVATGTTINVTDDNTLAGTAGDLAGVTIDTADSAAVTVSIRNNVNAATATASSLTGLTFTDAASVAITTQGGSASNVLGHALTGDIDLDDTDTTSVSITTSAYGGLTLGANDIDNTANLVTLTLSAASYGDITLDDVADATDLRTVSLTASGESADITIDDIGGGVASTALQTISMVATAGGEIDTGLITGAGSNVDTITITASGLNSDVTPGGAITTGNGSVNQVTISASDRGNVDMTAGDLTVGSGLLSAISVSATDRGTVDLDGFESQSTSTVTAGTWQFTTGTRGSITGGAAKIDTAGSLTALTVTVGSDSTFDFGTAAVFASGVIATTTVTVQSDATTAGALTIGDATTDYTAATITLSSDATNGGDINIVGDVATSLTVSLGGTADIDVLAGVVSFDGNADAIDWSGLTTVTTLTFSVGTSSGNNDLSFAAEAAKVNVTSGSGADTIVGSAGADTISAGAGADSIQAGNGIDSITSGTGSDTILITSSATANRDLITDFTLGTGGDVLKFDISDLGLAGGTVFVGAIGSVAVNSSDEILVLTGAGYASDDLAEDAVAARVTTDGLDVVVIYFNTTTNKVHIIHDTDAGVDAADGTVTLIGVLENVTTLAGLATAVAANIDTQA